MAARVVFVTHSQALVPVVEGLLPNETDPVTAAEMVRTVVTFGRPEALATADAAAKRLENQVRIALLEACARMHPERLGTLLADAPGGMAIDALMLAIGQHQEMAGHFAAIARERGSFWLGFLTSMHNVSMPVDGAALIAGLDSPAETTRQDTAYYVSFVAGHPGDALDKAALIHAADGAEADGALTWERAYRELARRALGRPARPIDWAALFEPLSPGDRSRYMAYINGSLLRSERRVVEKLAGQAMDGDEWYRSKASHDAADAFKAKTRVLPTFVAAQLPGMMAVTGCSSPDEDWIVVGEIAYGPDGRPRAIRPAPGRVNAACAATANIAFQVTIASRLQAIVPGVSDGVVLPFNRVFLKCAQQPGDPVARTTTRSGASRLPPKPLTPFSVKYPPTLRPHEVNGVVQVRLLVTSAGCASDAETLSSLHPLLDFEALRAVYSTKYSPSTVDGQPESVYLIWNAWFRP